MHHCAPASAPTPARALNVALLVSVAFAPFPPARAQAPWGPTYAIQQVGLLGPEQRDERGNSTNFTTLGAGGFVAGYAFRYQASGARAGRDAWLWDGVTRQINPSGGLNTTADGTQEATLIFINAAGQVVGGSSRYTSTGGNAGQDAWIWSGNAIRPIGLGGPGYLSTFADGLYQHNDPRFLSPAGQVAGHTFRYSAEFGTNGQDAWVWDGSGNGATRRIGLIDPENVGAGGYRASNLRFQNNSGQLVGESDRVLDLFGDNGGDAWIFSGPAHSGVTRRIGLLGPDYSGSAGFTVNEPLFLSQGGHVAGIAARIVGVNTTRGQDAWLWTGDATRPIGLSGAAYVGSAGYRLSAPTGVSDSGHAIGFTYVVTGENTTNGQDAWISDGLTTRPIGLTGGSYVGNAGYRFSSPLFINAGGRVAGFTTRQFNARDGLGQDSWLFDGAVTRRVGIDGPDYTYSREGRPVRSSTPTHLTADGLVIGRASRFDAASGNGRGQDFWVFDPSANSGAGASTLIGLITPAHTGSAGYRNVVLRQINASGQIWGYSDRISAQTNGAGRDAWVWSKPSPTTAGVTRQLGLTGGIYTSPVGYQFTEVQFQNAAGVIVGYSNRIVGDSGNIGQDAWYFDPVTSAIHAIPASVRTGFDNYAGSFATVLTEDGFMLGAYYYFEGGNGNGELRAFAFRPDRGFTELGSLVAGGGLAASGWAKLDQPEFAASTAAAPTRILGAGQLISQQSGSTVFALTQSPTPPPPLCPADFNADGLLNPDDLSDYIACFFSAPPCSGADVNADSFIDPDDLSDYIGAFFTGC